MLIFRLLNVWDSKNENSWDRLIEKQLGASIHPERRLGFIRSRQALIDCFAGVGQEISIEQLELESFSQVKNFVNFKISLAHNPEWGAALIANSTDYLSVGIDLENQQRDVKVSVLERISHPQDLKLKPIIIWVIKEAAFKALMNTHQFEKPIEFSSIKITNGGFRHHSSGIRGHWEQIPHESLMIIQAWIKKL